MFKEYNEEINIGVPEEREIKKSDIEEKSETMVNEIGGLEKMEPFHLDLHTQDIIREHFIKKDYEIIEMTDTHVKVRSSSGKTMTIGNEVAAKYFTSV